MISKPLALLAVAINATAGAQQQCESVISLSKVVRTTMEDKNAVDQHASNFCDEYKSAKSSGKSMTASASYKFLSASFGNNQVSSEEVASKYCGGDSSYSKRTDAYRQYVELISPGAYNAYQKCLDLSGDLKFEVDPGALTADRFHLTVTFSPQNAGSTAEVAYLPSPGVTCNWGGTAAKEKHLFTAPGTETLACNRKDISVRSFVTVYRSSGLTKMTIPWVPMTKDDLAIDTIVNMQDRLNNAERQLVEHNARLTPLMVLPAKVTDLETKNTTLQTNLVSKSGGVIPGAGGRSKTGNCPEGSYMVGIGFDSDPGGPHGIISGVAPVCRKLL